MTTPLTPASAPLPTQPGLPPLHAKLIYNLASGNPDESPQQLAETLSLLQAWNITAEVHLLGPDSDLPNLVADGIARGIGLFIAAGGDGTVESVANCLVGKDATLGILPTGTRNNLAYSLGILPPGTPSTQPVNLPAAAALLRQGRCVPVDAGMARAGSLGSDTYRWFFETASVGLLPAIFPASDQLQRGNFSRLGDLLAAWVSHQPGEMRIYIDDSPEPLQLRAHVALAANMPYFGARIQLHPTIAYDDGLMDLFTYTQMTKLDLIDYAVQVSTGAMDDPRVQHYRVRSFRIETDPPMPVNLDGTNTGETPLEVRVQPRALCVLTSPAPEAAESGVEGGA